MVDTIERLMLAARPVKQGSPTTVVSVVALALGSTTAEVRGGRRYKGAVRARHAAALALSRCGLNHPEIAKAIGVTDHTTAMSAVVSARARAEREPAFAAAVAEGVKAWGLPSGDEGRTVGV
jgi:chromosomal replication initiation ATPase DnaA